MAKALDSDPSHVAGEWREATLLGVRGDPRQFEDFIGNLGLQLGWVDYGPSVRGGFGESTAERLEPVVHLDPNRITNRNID